MHPPQKNMQVNIIALLLLACTQPSAEHVTATNKTAHYSDITPAIQHLQLQQKVDSVCRLLPAWLSKHHFNENQVIIADLSMHSGLPRMALVNVSNGKIVDSGLVAHGAGGNSFAATARFSNVPDSYCSSVGKYKIGAMYKGRFGDAFKLHGLENTNDKAYQRFVVLHAYDCVPDAPSYPEYLCNSLGCPMLSYAFLKRIKKTITASQKPMLLWIVE